MSMDTTTFNDKYFPRVDLSDKGRYQYYKYGKREFAYDKKDALLIQLFKDDEEIEIMGKTDAPYRVLNSIGFSRENWKNKEVRDEYLYEYCFELDDEDNYLAQDFIKNELPLYQKKESVEQYEYEGEYNGSSIKITVDGPAGRACYVDGRLFYMDGGPIDRVLADLESNIDNPERMMDEGYDTDRQLRIYDYDDDDILICNSPYCDHDSIIRVCSCDEEAVDYLNSGIDTSDLYISCGDDILNVRDYLDTVELNEDTVSAIPDSVGTNNSNDSDEELIPASASTATDNTDEEDLIPAIDTDDDLEIVNEGDNNYSWFEVHNSYGNELVYAKHKDDLDFGCVSSKRDGFSAYIIKDDVVIANNIFPDEDSAKRWVENEMSNRVNESINTFNEEYKTKWQYTEYIPDGWGNKNPETYTVDSEEEADEIVAGLRDQGIEVKGPFPIQITTDTKLENEDDEELEILLDTNREDNILESYGIDLADVDSADTYLYQMNRYIKDISTKNKCILMWRIFKQRVSLPNVVYKIIDITGKSIDLIINELKNMPLLVQKNAEVNKTPYNNNWVIDVSWEEDMNEYNESKNGGTAMVQMINEGYKGLNIDPFRPFNETDYYSYAGAEKIADDEPLIYSSDNCDIIIGGDEDDKTKCNIQVFIDENTVYGSNVRGNNLMSFPKALRLAKQIVDADKKSHEELIYFLDENMEEF